MVARTSKPADFFRGCELYSSFFGSRMDRWLRNSTLNTTILLSAFASILKPRSNGLHARRTIDDMRTSKYSDTEMQIV